MEVRETSIAQWNMNSGEIQAKPSSYKDRWSPIFDKEPKVLLNIIQIGCSAVVTQYYKAPNLIELVKPWESKKYDTEHWQHMDQIQQEMKNILPHHANTNTNSPAARHTQIDGSSSTIQLRTLLQLSHELKENPQ